jgi:sugar phosphate isomerase/epimerase
VDAVELVSQHLPVPDMRRIDMFRAGLEAAGIHVVNVPIDVGNISDRDPQRRAHDLRAIKVWLDVAAELGSPNVRVNTGRQDEPYDIQITIDSYNELADYASARGVRIL